MKYAEYVTLQIFKFELVMNLLIVKKKKSQYGRAKKYFTQMQIEIPCG